MTTRLILPILNSADKTITRARMMLSCAKNVDIDIIIHSTGSDIRNIYQLMEELVEYRIKYSTRKIRAHVPINALGYACLLCLVADEYYASPSALFSSFDIKIRTNILELRRRDIEHYLSMPVSGSLAVKLLNSKSIIDYYYPRFELLIKLHSKYSEKAERILKYLLHDPSDRLSSTDMLLHGSDEKLSVTDMIRIGAGPVGDMPDRICEYIANRSR